MRPMSSTPTITSYEQACAEHRWEVPERYNIAADVCDRHPRDKLAMIHEDFDGHRAREVNWGELQDTSNRFANVLTAHGVTARGPRGDAAAADARDRGGVLRDLEGRARSCSRCRCSTATTASATA